jgi:hypothetical protein
VLQQRPPEQAAEAVRGQRPGARPPGRLRLRAVLQVGPHAQQQTRPKQERERQIHPMVHPEAT